MSFSLAYRGFNYVSYYDGAYENADSLGALALTGANSAGLNLEYGIDVTNSTVYADANYTDSLAALGNTITEAKNLGLTVMVKPLIDFLDPTKIGSNSVGDWRAYYSPTNSAAFFASYKSMIVAEAQVAQAHGATLLSLGTELDQLTGPQYLSYWTDIISSVRAVFSGKLTYSADWNDDLSPWQGHNGLTSGTGDLATQVSFWRQLDYVGLDVYAPLSDTANPTLADLIAGWTQVPTDPESHATTGDQSLISYFESVAAQTGKPPLFTEIGYESATDAASQPAGSSTNVYDPALQANLYRAFFDAWKESGDSALNGVFFWNWDPNAAEVGPGNGANFSPQGLPAEDVVKANFKTVTTVSTDFNGDRTSDLLLQNGSTLADWTIHNGTYQSGLGIGALPSGWNVIGTGDFNGDGTSDLLFRNGSTLGDWILQNGTVQSEVGIGALPSGWNVIGTGDFNGDGTSDLLLQNGSTLGDWIIQNGTYQCGSIIGAMPSGWSVIGTGDFNGDGTTDLLLQNGSALEDWTLYNGTVQSMIGIGALPSGWNVVGTGDFNGDGTTDLLLQNAGNLGDWTLHNGTVQSMIGIGALPSGWNVIGTGDFNGDGTTDLLLQNGSTVGDWTIYNGTYQSGSIVGALPLGWTLRTV